MYSIRAKSDDCQRGLLVGSVWSEEERRDKKEGAASRGNGKGDSAAIGV